MDKAKRSELPVDIILEVLLRVPTKDLCRFRCVCKTWSAHISDPAFVAAQRSRSGPHLVGVFFGDCRRPPMVRVMDMEGNVVRELVVRVLGKDDGDGNILGGVLPQATATARRATTLVLSDGVGGGALRTGAHGMIIDVASGRAWACTVGTDSPLAAFCCIGCAAPSGAFKVIRLEDTSRWRWRTCNVATIVDGGLEALTWRQRSAPPFAISCYPEKRATVNGIAYFMRQFDVHDATSNSGVGHIAAFDIEREEWKMINGPTFEAEENIWYATLTELKGCLGMIQFIGNSPFVYDPNDDHRYALIWLLVDFNKCVWVKEYTIQMPKTWGLTKLLGALDDGQIVLLVRVLQKVQVQRLREVVVVFYNPSTKEFTELRDDTAMGFVFYHRLVLYTRSLLS